MGSLPTTRISKGAKCTIGRALGAVPTDVAPTVVTIGNFDGVHLGHCEVLDAAVTQAKARSAQSVAITFDPHPALVHRPEAAPQLIMGIADRIDTLASVGLDATLMIHYTLEFADQSAEDFVRSLIVEKLHAVAVVVGHDVRFGRNNSGDSATCKSWARSTTSVSSACKT